uniref:HAT C-terminal dimerisation domain-containing protein n=1 Tax=Sparus aurata TaxID=8175 RepID=A0A671X5W5_SPAAU
AAAAAATLCRWHSLSWLNTQKEMHAGAPRELQRLSDTRWACRHTACRTVLERLPAITRVLEEDAAENHGDRSIDARDLLTQIDLQFIGLLVTCTKVFGEAQSLSDILQSPSLDLCSAVDLVEALVQSFQDYRDESYFERLWKEVLNTAERCERSEQTRDSFRTSIFYPVLDIMLSELKRRFSKPNCAIMMGIQALNPSSATFCQEEFLFSFASIYACNIDDLRHEVHQMKRVLQRKEACGIQNTASCERSFSTLKLVKTYLCSTMDDDRLSNLGVLNVESSFNLRCGGILNLTSEVSWRSLTSIICHFHAQNCKCVYLRI